MSCKCKYTCYTPREHVGEHSAIITGQDVSIHWPQIPAGAIKTTTSVPIIVIIIDPFDFFALLINLLFNKVSDKGDSRQILNFFCSFSAWNKHIWDVLMLLLFTLSVPGPFLCDLANLLNVAAQSATVSYWSHHGCRGRVAGVISVPYRRVLGDHVLSFNDTLLRAMWSQICMTVIVYCCYL